MTFGPMRRFFSRWSSSDPPTVNSLLANGVVRTHRNPPNWVLSILDPLLWHPHCSFLSRYDSVHEAFKTPRLPCRETPGDLR